MDQYFIEQRNLVLFNVEERWERGEVEGRRREERKRVKGRVRKVRRNEGGRRKRLDGGLVEARLTGPHESCSGQSVTGWTPVIL